MDEKQKHVNPLKINCMNFLNYFFLLKTIYTTKGHLSNHIMFT